MLIHSLCRWFGIVFSVIITCSVTVAMASGALTASVDKAEVHRDETVLLRLRVEGESPRTPPDLSALTKHFDVLSRSQSHQMMIINGAQSLHTELQLHLAPRSVGKTTLPAIRWGVYQSQPITLTVLKTPALAPPSTSSQAQAAQPASPNVFLTVDVTPEQPYQDAMLRYSVKLYSAIPIQGGQLTAPQGESIWVHPDVHEQRAEVIQNGKQYTVYERVYAIYPKRTGELSIRSPQFVGRPMTRLWANRGAVNPSPRQPIRVSAPATTLQVQAKPDAKGAAWLPATALTLSEHWSSTTDQLKVGEPIERTVTVTAHGLTLAQLPALEWNSSPGMKIYPGKVTSHERFDGNTVISQYSQTITYIATADKNLTIPEIRLPWFDVASKKINVATVKARRFTVTDAVAPEQSVLSILTPTGASAPPSEPALTQPDSVEPTTQSLSSASSSHDTGFAQGLHVNILLAGTLIALCGIVGYGLGRYRRKNSKKSVTTHAKAATSTSAKTLKALSCELKTACYANDCQRARHVLGRYCHELSKGSGENRSWLQQQLQNIDELLYSNHPEKCRWDGKHFWLACKTKLAR